MSGTKGDRIGAGLLKKLVFISSPVEKSVAYVWIDFGRASVSICKHRLLKCLQRSRWRGGIGAAIKDQGWRHFRGNLVERRDALPISLD